MYHTRFDKFKWPCITCIKKNCKGKCCSCCNGKSETDVVSLEDGQIIEKSKGTAENGIELEAKKKDVPQTDDAHQKQNGQISTVNGGFTNKAFLYDNSRDPSSVESIHLKDDRPQTGSKIPKKRKKKSLMVRFFRTHYFAFVTHKVYRWLILLVLSGLLSFFVYKATTLTPDNEGLKVLKEGNVYRVAEDHASGSFVESDQDNTLIIYIVWGMFQNDMSNCPFSKPKCEGEKRWDNDFNPSTTEAQTALMAFCDKMFAFSEDRANELRIRKDYTTSQYQINCFTKNLKTFLDAETSYTLPFSYTNAIDFMNSQTTYYEPSNFNSSYQDHLEIPISYWLSNKYTYDRQEDFYLFDYLIGESIGTYSSPLKTDSTKKYGNDIKYIGIQVNTTIKYQTLGYEEGIPIMNKWEEFVSGEMKSMPAGVNNAFQTTYQIWHWMTVQEMLVNNAIYGIVIGVSLALPLLTIATMNIITGTLATFSICCSTICVIGMIPTGGWKLGVLESLNMCMVVGLTVDYVVHLAEGYSLSLHKDRLTRVQDMLDEMAVSIFFGACTTLGASLFMFVAQLSFFFQFGIFMFSTIGFSLVFSMGMFVTLMGIFGPQGDTGNLIVAFKKCRDCCKRRRGSKSNSKSISKSSTSVSDTKQQYT